MNRQTTTTPDREVPLRSTTGPVPLAPLRHAAIRPWWDAFDGGATSACARHQSLSNWWASPLRRVAGLRRNRSALPGETRARDQARRDAIPCSETSWSRGAPKADDPSLPGPPSDKMDCSQRRTTAVIVQHFLECGEALLRSRDEGVRGTPASCGCFARGEGTDRTCAWSAPGGLGRSAYIRLKGGPLSRRSRARAAELSCRDLCQFLAPRLAPRTPHMTAADTEWGRSRVP